MKNIFILIIFILIIIMLLTGCASYTQMLPRYKKICSSRDTHQFKSTAIRLKRRTTRMLMLKISEKENQWIYTLSKLERRLEANYRVVFFIDSKPYAIIEGNGIRAEILDTNDSYTPDDFACKI